MPWYVADFVADTLHLSAAEIGAYMLLIGHYWQRGGLPADDGSLARICRLSPEEWRGSRDVLAALFSGGWRHKRVDEELAKAADISNKRSASAKQRYSKSDANAEQEETQPPSPLINKAREVSRETEEGQAMTQQWSPSIDVSDLGLSQEHLSHELKRFRSFYLARGERRADWNEQWRFWLLNGTPDKPKPKRVEIESKDLPKIFDNAASLFVRTGVWTKGIGPEPGQIGCKCSPETLQKHGIDPVSGERPRRKTVSEALKEAG